MPIDWHPSATDEDKARWYRVHESFKEDQRWEAKCERISGWIMVAVTLFALVGAGRCFYDGPCRGELTWREWRQPSCL